MGGWYRSHSGDVDVVWREAGGVRHDDCWSEGSRWERCCAF